MNAYHKHRNPSKEMLELWSRKADLKERIIKKFPGIDKTSLDFKTPEQLEEILKYGN